MEKLQSALQDAVIHSKRDLNTITGIFLIVVRNRENGSHYQQ